MKLSEWSRADRAERLAWVDQVASTVPDGFRPLGEVAGSRSLPLFEHRPTRTRWVYVPGGSFSMGLSEREERAARAIEDPPPLNLDEMRPCHSVDLRPFLMMALPVTWGLALGQLKVKDLEDRPEFEGPRDARPAYLRRAEVERVASALGVGLPTEEQWEYACRGGTDTLFFFGDSLPNHRDELSALVGTEIEKNAPNPFGLKGLFSRRVVQGQISPLVRRQTSHQGFRDTRRRERLLALARIGMGVVHLGESHAVTRSRGGVERRTLGGGLVTKPSPAPRPLRFRSAASWTQCLALLVFATGSCGDPEDDGRAGADAYEDPRTMTEMCTKWCANAEANGCPDISGSDCMSSCTFVPLNLEGDCLRLYKNHIGCLADVPNVCDGELRNELCHDAYCDMREECDLPDPTCD